ncbi:purine phosphorylase family 1 [Candidatus Magnetomorum sp. HK-1]|nr:purine phosphorylase family 1 [Candidatus Magnetomorum sp. HK-1]
MKTDQIRSILILAAVYEELEPLLSKLSNSKSLSIGRKKAFTGKISEQSVIIVQCGIGIVNAVQALTAAVEKNSVGLILNMGCAGAFELSGLSIGDIGIATSETYIHSGVESSSAMNMITPLPFPLIQTNDYKFFAKYPTSENHTHLAYKILKQSFFSKDIHIKKIPFITVSTITAMDLSVKALYQKYQAGMENMEGAGIAHVAIQYGIPFLEIRAASNFVGERDKKKWQLNQAFERSALAVGIVIQQLDYKKILTNH